MQYVTFGVDGCKLEATDNHLWPETDLGKYRSVECPCSEIAGSLSGRLLRFCGGDYQAGAQWSTTDNRMCAVFNSNITAILCQMATVSK